MNLLLEEAAWKLPPGTHAAMLIDNAGWHVANELRVPPNITLVHLPPYSPELNAIEKVWQYLRDRYLSGRLFSGTRAIVDACCAAWNSLIAETGRIQSLADFDWVRQVNQKYGGYHSPNWVSGLWLRGRVTCKERGKVQIEMVTYWDRRLRVPASTVTGPRNR